MPTSSIELISGHVALQRLARPPQDQPVSLLYQNVRDAENGRDLHPLYTNTAKAFPGPYLIPIRKQVPIFLLGAVFRALRKRTSQRQKLVYTMRLGQYIGADVARKKETVRQRG